MMGRDLDVAVDVTNTILDLLVCVIHGYVTQKLSLWEG